MICVDRQSGLFFEKSHGGLMGDMVDKKDIKLKMLMTLSLNERDSNEIIKETMSLSIKISSSSLPRFTKSESH